MIDAIRRVVYDLSLTLTLKENIFADYFQFYVQDDNENLGNLADAWTDEAMDQLLVVAEGIVGVGTVRNVKVPVTLEVLDSEPSPDFEDWEHVVEGSLAVKTGRVVLAGCTDYVPDATRLAVNPGVYRARMSFRGLATLSEDGLDGDDEYRVQLWRIPTLEPVAVLKRRRT